MLSSCDQFRRDPTTQHALTFNTHLTLTLTLPSHNTSCHFFFGGAALCVFQLSQKRKDLQKKKPMMRSILRAFTSSRRGASASSPKSPKLSTLVAGQSTPTIREESLERYRPGGYHPVRIGDTFNSGRYKVVSKLGYGLYATVWLARDTGWVKNSP